MTDRFDDAAKKAPKDKPYVMFAEIAKAHEWRASALCSIYFEGTRCFNSSLQFTTTTMLGVDVCSLIIRNRWPSGETSTKQPTRCEILDRSLTPRAFTATAGEGWYFSRIQPTKLYTFLIRSERALVRSTVRPVGPVVHFNKRWDLAAANPREDTGTVTACRSRSSVRGRLRSQTSADFRNRSAL